MTKERIPSKVVTAQANMIFSHHVKDEPWVWEAR